MKVLEDESVLIDECFYLIGRKDAIEISRADMDTIVESLDPSKFMIVMDHQPHDYHAQGQSEVDLVVSGHTHGGQLMPFNMVGEWTGANE